MNRRIAILCLPLCCVIAAGLAAAQTPGYPSRPIRIVVPFPAGGTMDTVVRALGQEMTKGLGHPVIVENKPGAGTVLGVDSVAKAAPDGHTLVAVGNSFTVNQTLVGSLPYDALRDFRPIGLLTKAPNVLVGHPSIFANGLAELVAHAKAHPGKLSYASAGNGTIQHLAGEMLKMRALMNIVHVPYKGQAPATSDLLGGQVDLMIGNLPDLLPHIRAGKLKSFGVTTLERALIAPDLPTVAEQGYAGFETIAWFGLMAPSGVPDAIASRLNLEVVRALRSPDLERSLRAKGFETVPGSTEDFGRFLRAEISKYGQVIKEANIRID